MAKQLLKQVFKLLPAVIQQRVRQARKAAATRKIRLALASIEAPDSETPDINHVLHHFRGEALRRLPKGARHFVSVGCSGTWYFHWIAETYGHVELHTGVEFYSPQPSDLPHYTRWIANTAGDMHDIPDASADLLFSGQNIEHLWVEEIVGFLSESQRVLKEDGLLVVDSPNRLITAKLGWSHPEHTIEFTPDEMQELLTLAGFDLERQHGIWLCADPHSGSALPFEEMSTEGIWPLARRALRWWRKKNSILLSSGGCKRARQIAFRKRPHCGGAWKRFSLWPGLSASTA